MRNCVLIFTSVGLNIVLAAAWIISHRNNANRSTQPDDATEISTNQVKVVPYYRKQLFSWHEVESDDYPTYIANLRDIGCPADTIRDIIVADVNELYARKKATEIVTAGQQWWRSEPDSKLSQAAEEKTRALDEERRALLTKLLGANWDNSEGVAIVPKPGASVLLDGSVLGALSDNAKESVQQISERSQQRIQSYLDAQRASGKAADPIEVAKLRQQTRAELAAVLSPVQLEEFLLRYSENAANLRRQLGQLKYFNATQDEFKNIFLTTDPIEQQLKLLAGKNDTVSVQQRGLLEQQRENAIKNSLGPQRYAQYQRLQDTAYRDAIVAGQQLDSPQAVPVLAEINRATADERARIAGDTNLTAEQKAIELKRAELEQLKAQAQVAGKELPASELPPPLPLPPRESHTISIGESLTSIAQLYGARIIDIRNANPGVDFTKLKPGDSITMPKPAQPR